MSTSRSRLKFPGSALSLFFLLGVCAAQNVRYSVEFPSITSQYTTPFLVANVPPNQPILAVCSSPANALPCTNYATTYTSLGVACPNGSQDTPDPQPSACQSTGDAQGNIGFWAPPGTYDYTVCIQNSVSCFGPYTVTLGAAVSNNIVNSKGGYQQNGTALGINCGTTTTCADTATPLLRFVLGSVALSSGTPSTATVTGISPAFTSTATFFCYTTNATAQADPVKVVNTSSSSITLTGPNTVTDTVNYFCAGT